VGAPYIDELRLSEDLNHAQLSGVRFVPVQFTPASSVHKGEVCHGVFILLTDRDTCNAVDVGVQIAETLCRLYPRDFAVDKIDRLLKDPATLAAIKAAKPLTEIHALWKARLEEFSKCRAKYLMY
jgi:uncharacterized protein YbbC (DUF1343 family)